MCLEMDFVLYVRTVNLCSDGHLGGESLVLLPGSQTLVLSKVRKCSTSNLNKYIIQLINSIHKHIMYIIKLRNLKIKQIK